MRYGNLKSRIAAAPRAEIPDFGQITTSAEGLVSEDQSFDLVAVPTAQSIW